MDKTLIARIDAILAGKTRPEVEAHARSYGQKADDSRALRHFCTTDDEKSREQEREDEARTIADELLARARFAPEIRTARITKKLKRETAIFLWPTSLVAPPKWCVAVMSAQGTHSYNDFLTRDEALVSVARVRLNWPDLPLIEIIG